ncbi:ABC transporter permease subunit [Streptomyces sp. ISL-36]|uniref:ABC transporter permease n=1 Tax=Streptomyces sp. ISL-36 TaxID=2819182 RepID=UPI001BE7EB91|nr:ABC transporter permease subunit [Streptomyces sp. ISL-36]MBT2444202.1 ABC transporter permease subunit [Streptomyces sp. ISL-36]
MSSLALKGPYWVTVRQHRRAWWAVAATVGLSLVCVAGLRLWDSRTSGTNQDDGYMLLRVGMDLFSMGMIGLPLLPAVFVAGPMVARELESGTYKLALTQSVTPSRWFASKLLVAGAVTLGGTLALMAVYRFGWVRVTSHYQFTWSDQGTYEAIGTVGLAYGLLAVAVGAFVGQLVRRTVVAMAAAGGIMAAVLIVLNAYRWDFLTVRTITGPVGPTVRLPDMGLETSSGLITTTGQRLPGWYCAEPIDEHGLCRPDENIAVQYIDYHPASHFWPTQLIETGILLALAALALFAAFRVLRARHP